MAAVQPAPALGPVGFILPTFPQNSANGWSEGAKGTRALEAVARDAEAIGADAVWACDHLFWPGPTLECLTALTLAAGATTRASIGSCVLQLPLREPGAVAKQASTLQLLSGGRFILGVGVGSHHGEYAQAGSDYHTRGRRLDDAIDELHRAWSTAQLVDAEGPGARDRYRMLPESAAVPVWVGGSSEAALRRAARLGEGWMPLFLSTAEYSAALERLGKEIEAAGRPPGSVTPAMVLFVSVHDDSGRAMRDGTRWMSSMYGIPSKAFERHLVAGTAREVADTITAFRGAGAEHVVVYVTADEPLGQFEQLVGALAAAPAGS